MSDTYEADTVIAALEAKHPGVYGPLAQQIQEELYDEGVYQGNWDSSTNFENAPDLRLIQEDEYDQHRDDDMPDEDEMIAQVSDGYLFYA